MKLRLVMCHGYMQVYVSILKSLCEGWPRPGQSCTTDALYLGFLNPKPTALCPIASGSPSSKTEDIIMESQSRAVSCSPCSVVTCVA